MLMFQASWLGTAFLLGLAAVSPLCGRLSQIIGRKGALLSTLLLFLGESYDVRIVCSALISKPER